MLTNKAGTQLRCLKQAVPATLSSSAAATTKQVDEQSELRARAHAGTHADDDDVMSFNVLRCRETY